MAEVLVHNFVHQTLEGVVTSQWQRDVARFILVARETLDLLAFHEMHPQMTVYRTISWPIHGFSGCHNLGSDYQCWGGNIEPRATIWC